MRRAISPLDTPKTERREGLVPTWQCGWVGAVNGLLKRNPVPTAGTKRRDDRKMRERPRRSECLGWKTPPS